MSHETSRESLSLMVLTPPLKRLPTHAQVGLRDLDGQATSF